MWIYDKREKIPKTYMDIESLPKIEGYDFNKPFDFREFSKKYLNMGFQGSNMGKAIMILSQILKEREQGLNLFISFTGNMISSGNREIINYLVRNKIVHAITTTAAALEEDIIKCIKSFHLGSFDVQGKFLMDECVGRIGNIFVPYDRYLYLERFLNNFFSRIKEKQESMGVLSSHEVAGEMGIYIGENELTKPNCEDSFLYQAARNGIKVFCPGIVDGAIGDISVFFKRKNPEFAIDSIKDSKVLVDELSTSKKTASLVLGGGIAKHFLLNSAIFIDGFDYSVYLTTASEHDGSDSGGNQEEAITWAKIKPNAQRVKVNVDATIGFPLLMASALNNKD